MKFVFLSLFLLSAQAAKLTVDSNPADSTVAVVDKNGNKNIVGKTPYNVELDELAANYGSNNPLQLEISKGGFETYSVVIPNVKKVDIGINASLEVEKDIKFTQDFDFLMGDLFDVLRMIRGNDYETAMGKLEQLESKFPHFSIIYEMKGSIAYLQKDFKKSLNYYRKSFSINPKNREAYRMKMYLEKKFGVATQEKQ